jgi:hypothetical protein
MKKLLLTFVFSTILSLSAFCGTLKGAWEMLADAGANERVVMIATEKYLSIAVYEQNHFVRTYGGPYDITEAGLTLALEFDSKTSNQAQIGTKITYKYSRKENEFTIENLAKTTWKRIDNNKENLLAGLWQITSRENPDGTMGEMKRGARKTIKINSGTRFQWVAMNTETKEFFGTGGGTYTVVDGKYTENIELFSRDDKRVGTSLSFDAKVTDNQWNHSGKSSTGNKINEIWTREN